MNSDINKLDKATHHLVNVHNQFEKVWYHEVLFTWRWWFCVILSIVLWILWIIFHNKKSTFRLLTAGFFVMVFSLIFDALGIHSSLWFYRYGVAPFMPPFLPFNLSLIPITILSLIEFKPKINPFIKSIVFGLLSAYVGEPIYIALEVYVPIHWHHYISFPIYTVLFLIAYWITQRESYEKIDSDNNE